MINKILLPWLLAVFFLTGHALSQTKEIDSLKIALLNAKEDTSKVNILNNLSYKLYVCNNNEASLHYAKQQLLLAKKLSYLSGEAYALRNIGNYYRDANRLEDASRYFKMVGDIGKKINSKKLIGLSYGCRGGTEAYKGNYTEAAKNWDTALVYYREIGDRRAVAITMENIGTNYYDQANYSEAIRYLYAALKYWEEINDETMMGDCYYYIGDIKVEQKNYYDALKDYNKAVAVNIKLSKETNTPSSFPGFAALALTKIGEVYLILAKPDAAFTKFNEALNKLNEAKFSWALMGGKSKCYTGIGKIYELRGDSAKVAANKKDMKLNFLLAYENYKKALDTNIEEGYGKIGFENDIPKIYQLLGNISMKLNNYAQAKNWFNKALVLSFEKKARLQIRDSYLSLSKFYETYGDSREAYNNYKNYISYRDSIVNEESIKKSEGYKLQYEFDKKENSLKQKQFITETKLKAEKKQKYFYWGGLAMLALLSFFVFLNFRNQKKINRLAKENFAKERAELELQILRTQLNPHFIFNCISSIDGLIQNNEKYSATNYLNKFAKLMRNVLENSKDNTIAFSNDIETLKLYLDLEQLRNEDKYSTQLNISEELLNTDYIVPPLIIQPFVENAIQHGLKNKPGKDGLLKININRVEDHLQYIIADNGIGRQATAKDKMQDHKSYGVKMSIDRIKLFNNEESASVKIEDKFDNGIATGTTVTVKLKLK